MRADIHDEAKGRWRSILPALGVKEEFLRNRHGRCPFGCKGKRSYRFDDKAAGMWICTHCGAGNGIDMVMRLNGLDFKGAVEKVREVLPSSIMSKPEQKQDAMPKLRALWNGSRPARRGDDVDLYLGNRGIDLAMFSPGVLRWHPGLEYFDDESKELVGKFSAMLAAIRDTSGAGCGMHITYLVDGQKAQLESPRKIKGTVPPGAAVRLGPVEGCMGVAEGIETAMAYSMKYRIPVWACLSDGGLRRFTPPDGVKYVEIAGDNDENFVGQAAAFDLAKRLCREGREVEVNIPGIPGTDWADQQ